MLKRQAYHWAKGTLGDYFESLGDSSDEQLCRSITLYGFCTQFKTLPVGGGLYDQDPQLLEEWNIISRVVTEVLEEETPSDIPSTGKSPASRGLNYKKVNKVPNMFNNTIWQNYHLEK